MPRAMVAGGGLAGCAAAVRLAGAGWRVTLLERHPRLGGKLSSFPWRGRLIDNGQHVAAKTFTALRAFLETIGAGGGIRWQERLRVPFASPGGRITTLSRWNLPAPLHLLPGLLAFDLLPFWDRLGFRRVLNACKREIPDATDFRAWLEAQGQGEPAVRRFWDPLIYAVCNAGCAEVGAAAGAWVVREALLGSPDALDLGIPTVHQGDLIAPGVSAFLSARGGEIRTEAAVESVVMENGRAAGLALRDGETLKADAVVLAVPWEAVGMLLPETLRPKTEAFGCLRPGAVLSVTLALDRPVLPEGEEFVGLVDQPVQWAFSKRALGLNPGEGELLSLVVSGANALADRSQKKLVAMAVQSLEACLPRMAGARILDAVAMKEKRATFLPAPGSAALRPGPDALGVPGLALAGAWTATGWPATLEGAVRSGNAAVEALLKER